MKKNMLKRALRLSFFSLSCLGVLSTSQAAWGGVSLLEDDFENVSDSFEAATFLELEPTGTASVFGSLPQVLPDVDFFSFDVNAQDWLIFDTDRSGFDTDTALSLFDPSGNLVAFNDDRFTLNANSFRSSVIAPFQADSTGQYRIAVSNFPNFPESLVVTPDLQLASSFTEEPLSLSGVAVTVDPSDRGNTTFDLNESSEGGEYGLLASRFQSVGAIFAEPGDFGDDRASAFDLGEGDVGTAIQVDGELFGGGDVDVFSLNLNSGTSLYLDTDTLFPVDEAASIDTVLSLFDSTGELIAFSDINESSSTAAGLGAVAAPITVEETGNYFVSLTSFPSQPIGLSSAIAENLSLSGQSISSSTSEYGFEGVGEASGRYSLLVLLGEELSESTSIPESSTTFGVAVIFGLLGLGCFKSKSGD